MTVSETRRRIRAAIASRPMAFIEPVVRDILYAFRTFRHAPLAALTIVATVAVGLGTG
jgi:hypothetical protein